MKLGPDNGTVTVRTGVAGSASRMGHRLVIQVQEWSAEVEMDGQVPVSVRFAAGLDSLRVQSGSGGVTPLTVVDKQVIRRNAAKVLQSDTYPQAVFEGTVSQTDGGMVVSGELQIHGVTQQLTTTLCVDGRHVTAAIPVAQTDFGLKPYSAMVGQLKVLDEVSVEVDIEVPAQ